jgi:hypothetical protein
MKNINGVVKAYEKGYRVIDGDVISPYDGKKRKLYLYKDRKGTYRRYTFNITGENRFHKYTVNVHQLIAYQKYGNIIFNEGIEVRHIDGNSLNNKDDNIIIGSRFDNEMDKPIEIRQKSARSAASRRRVFTNDEIEDIRKRRREGASYGSLMSEFGIVAKSSVRFFLNNNYVTEKHNA